VLASPTLQVLSDSCRDKPAIFNFATWGHYNTNEIQLQVYLWSIYSTSCPVKVSASQEVGGTLIGEDRLMVMAGMEYVDWYQIQPTHGFHVIIIYAQTVPNCLGWEACGHRKRTTNHMVC
jgi:hypothetical protein